MTGLFPSPRETMASLHEAMRLIEGGHHNASGVALHNLMERFYEAAAGGRGWQPSKADIRLIAHPTCGCVYETWRECCEGEDIEVGP